MDSTGASPSPFDSFRSKKVLRSSVSKPHSSGEAFEAPDQSLWSSKTPEKPTHPPRRHPTRGQALRSINQVREAAKKLRKSDLKPSASSDLLTSSVVSIETPTAKPNNFKTLPENYEILDKFFNCLDSGIRYLGLKGYTSTFTNISPAIENLSDRRFSYSHLAQLKFILPEAIEIKKILVRDDRTCCMKPDLHVTLNFSIIKNDENLKSESTNLQMRKLFRSRLVNFCKSNPEGADVPEEMLPEPFNQSSQLTFSTAIKPNLDLGSSSVSVSSSDEEKPFAISQEKPIVASHIPQSFKRHFSKHVPIHNVEETFNCATVAPSPVKQSAKLPETPIKSFDLGKKDALSSIDGTPVKLISSPFSATPAQAAQPPVRCFMTPNEDSIMSPSKLTRRSSRKKSITFDTPVKNKTAPVKRVSTDHDDNNDDDLHDILSGDLLASIKEKEQKALEENDPEISQAKWRKQMIAGLPKLFDTLLFYFQSIKRSVITKEELMHTILSSQLEIVDRREVDEQLRLLQELAPEWIYEKMASSGDLLICVNKISSPESIRTRLSEAY